ncbi:MAG: PQQ-binding-like beta-propeller repeat protein, partial [Acidobacteriota bacterium]
LWSRSGHLGGYSSPVSDGELVYQVDNGSNLGAFDAATGERLWIHELGTIQKSSPVLADGKLYVGSENGTFYILRPSRDGVEVLDSEDLTRDDGEGREEIIGSPAVARGRVYLASYERLYAIGPDEPRLSGEAIERPDAPTSDGPVAQVQVFPQELILAPGESQAFEARLFDADGAWVRTVQGQAAWSVEGIAATVTDDATLQVAADAPAAGGRVVASIDGVEGSARLRVVPELPWSWDFDAMESIPSHWVSALGKFRLEEQDGSGVLVKNNENPFLKRTKVYMGPNDLHDYTLQVDFKSAEERRRLGDAGLIGQRYSLILFGAKQQLMVVSWHAELERAASVQYRFDPDVWYRMKMRVENLPDGQVAVRGKLWPREEPEPEDWTIEQIDELGARHGSPGLYADAHALVSFDNLEVVNNR